MIFNGARMIGPAIAGLLIAVIGMRMCFFLNGVSYLAVIWSLFAMVLPARQRIAVRPRDVIGCARARIRLASSPDLLLAVIVAINSGFGMQYSVLIPVFARDILQAARAATAF